jgi:hypothetical protein
MEPYKTEKSEECHGVEQISPPDPPERKHRFQLIKLEERIAPQGGAHGNSGRNSHCFFCGP